MASTPEARLDKALEWALTRKNIEGVVVSLYRDADGFTFEGAAGELSASSEFFIASTTKLMTTALILRLAAERRLSLDASVAALLPELPLDGLHVYKGEEYTQSITVRHLLSQTSGVADYFQGKQPGGTSLEDSVVAGIDSGWDALQALEWAKDIGAAFPPGQKGKALYSDTNYQLLGVLIEQLYERSYREVVATEIAQPLGLEKLRVFTESDDCPVVPIRVDERQVHVPRAMSSFGPDGGIVSTAGELMTFLRGFFGGRFFPQAMLPDLMSFNRLFFPLEYGVGLMRFRMPWIFSPFKPMPALLGHSGLSGAFAFFAPDRGLYLTGTVNQLKTPSNSFQLMMRLLGSL